MSATGLTLTKAYACDIKTGLLCKMCFYGNAGISSTVMTKTMVNITALLCDKDNSTKSQPGHCVY